MTKLPSWLRGRPSGLYIAGETTCRVILDWFSGFTSITHSSPPCHWGHLIWNPYLLIHLISGDFFNVIITSCINGFNQEPVCVSWRDCFFVGAVSFFRIEVCKQTVSHVAQTVNLSRQICNFGAVERKLSAFTGCIAVQKHDNNLDTSLCEVEWEGKQKHAELPLLINTKYETVATIVINRKEGIDKSINGALEN